MKAVYCKDIEFFLVNFLNIFELAKYLKWININNSFYLRRLTIQQKLLEDFSKYKLNNEEMIEKINCIKQFMFLNLFKYNRKFKLKWTSINNKYWW